MAAAAFDIQSVVGKNVSQSSRRVELKKRVDFSKINAGAGLAAGEDAAFMTTPKGFVYERCDSVQKTPEGAAGTVDIGTAAASNGMLDGGDANSTADTTIALAGTESIKAGTLMSETEVRVAIAAAQPTLDTAIIDITLVGYLIDL